MNFTNIIDRIKLPFRKEKEFYLALYNILGFYPHKIDLYKNALMHSSVRHKGKNGRQENNERLEFLGDAILDAVVGDIVYKHFKGKREGFLTNTRSKLVQRATLGKLAEQLGVNQLILSAGNTHSHNSYMGGNAFEALVGAAYLDRGYDAIMDFMQNRILGKYIDLDKTAKKEVNFKSKLLEWTQKNRVKLEYKLVEQSVDKENDSPMFEYKVQIEGVDCGVGKGYSKKESQQKASKETLQLLRKQPKHVDKIFAAKSDRTKMEEMPIMEVIPDVKQDDSPFINTEETQKNTAQTPEKIQNNHETEVTADKKHVSAEDFDLSDISLKKKTREEIIAEAEAAAFANG
ncbi:MAG: ribonuclease III [Bacteroidaceae bacterium]|nr:ribonuclease III [Bacteroidaceae bacterium]